MMTQEQVAAWNYQTDSVVLIPHVPGQNPKDSLFPEEMLIQVYFRLKAEKTLDFVFPGRDEPNLSEFIAYFHHKPILVGLIKTTEWKIMGIGWLWDVEGPKGARKASCVYVVFREFWGRDEVRMVARMALRYWFDEYGLKIIYGAALKTNLRAQRFDREMGFRKVAELERFFIKNGQMHDAVIVAMTEEEFRASEG